MQDCSLDSVGSGTDFRPVLDNSFLFCFVLSLLLKFCRECFSVQLCKFATLWPGSNVIWCVKKSGFLGYGLGEVFGFVVMIFTVHHLSNLAAHLGCRNF